MKGGELDISVANVMLAVPVSRSILITSIPTEAAKSSATARKKIEVVEKKVGDKSRGERVNVVVGGEGGPDRCLSLA